MTAERVSTRKLFNFGELGDDVFGDTVAEIFVFLDAAGIFEIERSQGFLGALFGDNAARIGFVAEFFKIVTELGGSLIARAAAFLHGGFDDLAELGRNVRVQARRGGWSAIQNGIKDDGGGVAGEGLAARGHFVENDAEGKEISAQIEFFAASLFGGHVGNGAEGGPGTGEIVVATGVHSVAGGNGERLFQRGTENFGEAEVEDLGLTAFGNENVGGLDVAMDDALGVGGVECIGNLDAEVEDGIGFEGAPFDAMFERVAFEKLHGDEVAAVVIPDVVDGADVGMVQGRSGTGLAAKALDGLSILGGFFGEEFKGETAAEACVFGLVDDTHTAAAKFLDDAIVT